MLLHGEDCTENWVVVTPAVSRGSAHQKKKKKAACELVSLACNRVEIITTDLKTSLRNLNLELTT